MPNESVIWSRRGFLKLLGGSALALATGGVELTRRVQTVGIDRLDSAWLSGIIVENMGAGPSKFVLSRNGQPVLSLTFGHAGWLRWDACPGDELLFGPQGLQNASDIDVRILSVKLIREDDRHYAWTPDGGMQALDVRATAWNVVPFVDEQASTMTALVGD